VREDLNLIGFYFGEYGYLLLLLKLEFSPGVPPRQFCLAGIDFKSQVSSVGVHLAYRHQVFYPQNINTLYSQRGDPTFGFSVRIPSVVRVGGSFQDFTNPGPAVREIFGSKSATHSRLTSSLWMNSPEVRNVPTAIRGLTTVPSGTTLGIL